MAAGAVLKTVLGKAIAGADTQVVMDRLRAAFAVGRRHNLGSTLLIAGGWCDAVLAQKNRYPLIVSLICDLERLVKNCPFNNTLPTRKRNNAALSHTHVQQTQRMRQFCLSNKRCCTYLAECPPDLQVAEVACCMAAALYGFSAHTGTAGKWRPQAPSEWHDDVSQDDIAATAHHMRQLHGPGWRWLQYGFYSVLQRLQEAATNDQSALAALPYFNVQNIAFGLELADDKGVE